MAKTLEWLFQVDDRVTGPAKAMGGALAQLDAKLKTVDAAMRKLEAPAALAPSTAIAPKTLRQPKKKFELAQGVPNAADALGARPQGANVLGGSPAVKPEEGAARAWAEVDEKARRLAETFARMAGKAPSVQPPAWMREINSKKAEALRVADAKARLGSASSVIAQAPSKLAAPGTHQAPAWMRELGEKQGVRARARELAAFAKQGTQQSVQIGKAYATVLHPPKADATPFAELGKGMLSGLGGAMLLGGVAGIAAEATSKLVELGAKAVELVRAGMQTGLEAASFRESTVTGFKIMTGSAELGAGLMDQALRFARSFGMESSKVADEFKQILAAKFSTKEVPILFQAMHDVDASGGNSQSLLGGFGSALQNKRIHYEDVKSLAAAANVDFNQVFDAMAKKYNRSRLQLVRHLQGEIGLDPRLGIFGVVETLRKKLGGEVGGGIAEQAQTLEGQLTVLRDTITRTGAGAIPTPGFDLFKQVITGLNASLTEGTPGAAKLESVFKHLDGIVGNLFSRWSGPGGMKLLADDVNVLLGALDGVASALERISRVLGPVLSAGVSIAKFDIKAHGLAADAGSSVLSGAADAVSAPMKLAKYSPLSGVMDSVADSAFGALNGLLSGPDADVQKPNGGAIPGGIPKLAAGGIADKPTLAEVGHGREAIVPLTKGRRLIDDVLGPAGGSGKTIIIRPEINLQVSVSGGEDADRLVEKLEPVVRRIVDDAMEDAARELGAEEPS